MNVICVPPESSSVERYIYIHNKEWMAVSNLRYPEADRDAATKQYVDENMGGFTPGNPVAKNGADCQPGGFYESGGNLFYKSY